VQGVVDFLKRLGAARLAAMGAVTLALVGFFAFVILRVSQPTMVPLFTDMTVQDSAGIVRELERLGVPFELRREGSTIAVPQEQVTRLRMSMAELGLPKGGGVGYEIFDKTDSLGATSFVQNINHLRALEGELARTIRAIDRIQSARVHLVLPERALFSRDRQEPSASIVLKVRGTLEGQQVRSIRHLVASAVQGLKPERISIVDEAGTLLASGAADPAAAAGVDERHVAHERRLREQVEAIVSSVVGPGRARVQVAADMDFNRVTQTSDTFDPEGRVVRSTQTREEQSQSSEGREGAVSVGNELPGATGQRPAEQSPRDQARKSEEIVNYEISRTQRTEILEAGRIRRVSVAVLVDGIYTKDAQGNVTYQERPQAEMARIAALVRSTIGFDQRRGDQVEVVNLRFAESPVVPAAEAQGWMSYFSFTKDDIMRAIELGVMLILSLLVILLVVRPLMRRILAPESPVASGGALPGGTGTAAIAGGATAGAIAASPEAQAAAVAQAMAESETAKMIDIVQVQGQVHAASVQRIGELVEKNPHETANIIRQWLTDPQAA
jgi:flagellar M-ring protein FliF